ncbi:17439_t:CDS:1, partial [Gigaspora rosea]
VVYRRNTIALFPLYALACFWILRRFEYLQVKVWPKDLLELF